MKTMFFKRIEFIKVSRRGIKARLFKRFESIKVLRQGTKIMYQDKVSGQGIETRY